MNYENLLEQANSVLPLIEPFLEEYIALHEAYEASDGKLRGEAFTLFLESTNYDRSGEKILQYLKNLITDLSLAQSDNDEKLLELRASKEIFHTKFKVYELLLKTLTSVDTAFTLRHEMYSQNKLWEDYLEPSTATILESVEDGHATLHTLSENVNIILQAFLRYNFKIANKSVSEVYQEKQRRENYQRKFQSIIKMLKENTSLFESVIIAYTLI